MTVMQLGIRTLQQQLQYPRDCRPLMVATWQAEAFGPRRHYHHYTNLSKSSSSSIDNLKKDDRRHIHGSSSSSKRHTLASFARRRRRLYNQGDTLFHRASGITRQPGNLPQQQQQRWMLVRGGKENHSQAQASTVLEEPGNGAQEEDSIITTTATTTNTRPKSIVEAPENNQKDLSTPPRSTTTTWRQRVGNRLFTWRRSWRRRAGELLNAAGFLSSAAKHLVSNHNRQEGQSYGQRLQPTIDALQKFLHESQLHEQLSHSLLSYRLVENLVVLSRFQKEMNQTLSLQERASLETTPPSSSFGDEQQSARVTRKGASNNEVVVTNRQGQSTSLHEHASAESAENTAPFIPSVEQALRYMKFATAAYGDAMIRAAQLDVRGEYKPRIFESHTTLSRVSEHVGIPPSDIVLLDIDYGGSDEHLRHFVAINHAEQEIVLSIRGTYSLAELVVDAAGFAEPFGEEEDGEGGGQAHAEIAKQAAVIWQAAGPSVLEFWDEHPDYTLILTGHSLGAGVACLLNLLLCHRQEKSSKQQRPLAQSDDACTPPPGREIRCVAFAAPPVYYNPNPSTNVQQAMKRCVNFLHAHDMVPFLSVDSIRYFLAQLEIVDERMRALAYADRLRLFWGYKEEIDPEWIEALQQVPRPEPLPGAPCLYIPAAVNVWLSPRRSDNNGSNKGWDDHDDDPNVYYQAHRCDAIKLATEVGLQVDLNMLQDHFPPRYEHALHYFHPTSSMGEAQF